MASNQAWVLDRHDSRYKLLMPGSVEFVPPNTESHVMLAQYASLSILMPTPVIKIQLGTYTIFKKLLMWLCHFLSYTNIFLLGANCVPFICTVYSMMWISKCSPILILFTNVYRPLILIKQHKIMGHCQILRKHVWLERSGTSPTCW